MPAAIKTRMPTRIERIIRKVRLQKSSRRLNAAPVRQS